MGGLHFNYISLCMFSLSIRRKRKRETDIDRERTKLKWSRTNDIKLHKLNQVLFPIAAAVPDV